MVEFLTFEFVEFDKLRIESIIVESLIRLFWTMASLTDEPKMCVRFRIKLMAMLEYSVVLQMIVFEAFTSINVEK